jgi:hypothetical protein
VDEIEEVRERFKELVHMKSDNKSDFATKIGFARPDNVNNFYNGKTNNLSVEIMAGISKNMPDFNFNWLLKGEMPMFFADNSYKEIQEGFEEYRTNKHYESKYFEALEEIHWLVKQIRQLKNKLSDHGIE